VEAAAFDAMGVLYEVQDDMRALLIPFARAHGSTLSDRDIGNAYRCAMIGELTARELWSALGVAGDAPDLDREYLSGYRVVPGIPALLDELRDQGLELGCISNDVAAWSLARSVAHGLDRRIRHWTISSEVGARKPDERMYRAFLTSAGLTPEGVVFVDDRAVNVDAAAALGFRTILVDFAALGQDHPRAARTVEDLRHALRAFTTG